MTRSWRYVCCCFAMVSALRADRLPAQTPGASSPPAVRAATEFPPELVDFVPRPGPPLLAGTGADTWDRKIRERGFVFREGGLWHLYYTGYNDARSDARYLGYATSPDGLVWTRWPGNPLTTTGWVEDVDIVKHGGTYYMFSEGRDDIAHMLTSKDRLHWQEQGNLNIHYVDGRPLSPGPYGTPTVWLENGRWYLFYERRDRGVWLATSCDLKLWTNVQDDPVLAPGPDRCDRYLLALDQVIKYRGRYYGYYHGLSEKGSKNWTTCVAVSNDLIHWRKYPKNPIVDGDKSSSILIRDGVQFRLYTMHPDVRVYFPHNAK